MILTAPLYLLLQPCPLGPIYGWSVTQTQDDHNHSRKEKDCGLWTCQMLLHSIVLLAILHFPSFHPPPLWVIWSWCHIATWNIITSPHEWENGDWDPNLRVPLRFGRDSLKIKSAERIIIMREKIYCRVQDSWYFYTLEIQEWIRTRRSIKKIRGRKQALITSSQDFRDDNESSEAIRLQVRVSLIQLWF